MVILESAQLAIIIWCIDQIPTDIKKKIPPHLLAAQRYISINVPKHAPWVRPLNYYIAWLRDVGISKKFETENIKSRTFIQVDNSKLSKKRKEDTKALDPVYIIHLEFLFQAICSSF